MAPALALAQFQFDGVNWGCVHRRWDTFIKFVGTAPNSTFGHWLAVQVKTCQGHLAFPFSPDALKQSDAVFLAAGVRGQYLVSGHNIADIWVAFLSR